MRTLGTSFDQWVLLYILHNLTYHTSPSLFLPHHVFQRYAHRHRARSSSTDFLPATAIREFDAKLLLAYWLERAPAVHPNFAISAQSFISPSPKVAQVSWDPSANTITPDNAIPEWVLATPLVAKPDQLIKRRGKAGLLALNKSWLEAKKWIQDHAGKPQRVRYLAARIYPRHILFELCDPILD